MMIWDMGNGGFELTGWLGIMRETQFWEWSLGTILEIGSLGLSRFQNVERHAWLTFPGSII